MGAVGSTCWDVDSGSVVGSVVRAGGRTGGVWKSGFELRSLSVLDGGGLL